MLRSLVLAIAILCLVGAAIALAFGYLPGALMAGIWGTILLLGTLYERAVYKANATQKPTNAVRTNERFVDDVSGKLVTVYVDPKTGERTYVEE